MDTDYWNHYEVLGLTQTADISLIKDAFRKLSMIHHPDKNDNSEKSNTFYKIIINAYKILSDDERRALYDAYLRKSDYLKKYVKCDKTYLPVKRSFTSREILERVNVTLWDVDDLVRNGKPSLRRDRFLLIILTFLDRWILVPSGFPDYFLEARKLERRDPRELINELSQNKSYKRYSSYTDIRDYFLDVRRRTDKFITKYQGTATGVDSEENSSLIDSLIEYHDLAAYYLGYLLKGDEEEITFFEFSKAIYDYDYPECIT
jgi:curved DNA-binding protein CbpA